MCGREGREGGKKKERKRLFHNPKEHRLFRATLSLNSRLMQNKKKKSIIKYTASEAAVTAEHLASATVCNNILSFLCSIVTASQRYCFLYSPPFLLGLIPRLLRLHAEWREKKKLIHCSPTTDGHFYLFIIVGMKLLICSKVLFYHRRME